MKKLMYEYLVKFTCMKDDWLTPGSGTSQILRKKKIKSFEDLEDVASFIQSGMDEVTNLAIDNFILVGRNWH